LEAGIDIKRVEYSGLKPLKNYLLSLKEEELRKLVEGMVDALLEIPLDRSIFLLGLSKL
jgi:hypothetical protein